MRANRFISKFKKIGPRFLRLGIVLLTPFLIFYTIYIGRVYPGVKMAGIDIGGQTYDEAVATLKQNLKPISEIILVTPTNQEVKIPTSTINVNYDFGGTVDKAMQIGRTGSFTFDIDQIIGVLLKKNNYGVMVKLNEEELTKDLGAVAATIVVDPVYPSIKLVNANILIEKGKAGIDIDRAKLRADIGHHLSYLDPGKITITTIVIDPTLRDSDLAKITEKTKKLVGKSLTVKSDDYDTTLTDTDLVNLISPDSNIDQIKLSEIIDNLSGKINRDPQNASFVFEDGKVKEFAPGKDGIKIKTEEFKNVIIDAINSLIDSNLKEVAITPPADIESPKVKTSDVNNLGIKELIGRGTSEFAGSIPNRIHNVALATSRINGVLVAPGETLSFNEALGDVSVYTGYKQAYVIKDGKTVLGDGGGVCQVSTTLFRAAMNAGLGIVERNAHAYRVHYYEEDMGPGYDATVYSPTTDLKIKNTTDHYILIQTHTDLDNLKLTFDIYGTTDGRVATVSKANITSVSPAPPTLYIDDPTLPAGVIRQIDFSAPGAKVNFSYSVVKDGQTIENQTFYSNYRPWQAKFLRGIKI